MSSPCETALHASSRIERVTSRPHSGRSFAAYLLFLGALMAGGGCMADTPVCINTETDAEKLIESANQCESDADCQLLDAVTKIPNACFGAFHCSIPVRKDIDEAEFLLQANKIRKKYEDSCSECAKPKCADPSNFRASCGLLTRRCGIKAL